MLVLQAISLLFMAMCVSMLMPLFIFIVAMTTDSPDSYKTTADYVVMAIFMFLFVGLPSYVIYVVSYAILKFLFI